ncbi:hypothetical protein EC957_009921 [Mortierella hygrophila]|uniref:Uncharacterized protein n=1 Tax=Mortierella hygrophila TaxID=979708 RepID=A0A9P6JXS3_9FUNG|nr:hypothetical protein EC957_009921 [Mortierella hygrophila]
MCTLHLFRQWTAAAIYYWINRITIKMQMYFGLNEIKAVAFIQDKEYATTLRFTDGDTYSRPQAPIKNNKNVQPKPSVLSRRPKGRRASLDPQDYQPLTPSSSSSSEVGTTSYQPSASSYETCSSSPSFPVEDQDGTPAQ